jgi:hypothetical protein
MIVSQGRHYTLRSHTGRVLMRSPSRKAVMRREKQINFFRNLRNSSGKPGSLLAKVRPSLRRKELRRRRAAQ